MTRSWKEFIFTGRALFFIVLVFLLTLKTHRTYIGQGDEPHYIVVAESLYLDRDLDLVNNYVSPYLRSFTPDDHAVVRKADGRQLPFHAVGLSILGVPVYAVAHAIIKTASLAGAFTDKTERWIFIKNCFSFSMMALASWLSVLLFKIFFTLFSRQRTAWLLALIFSLSPPLLAYGLIFFTELPSALLITGLMLSLIGSRDISPLDGFLMGALPWLHAKNYTIALAFAALFAHRQLFLRRQPDGRINVAPLLWPAAIAIALWIAAIATNYHLWGGISPSSAWSQERYKTFEARFLPVAIPALFMDRSFGLFVFAPIYLLFPCGLALMFRRNAKTALYILILLASYLVTVSGFKFWWGGWSPGPRYLVPIVPLLAMAAAMFIQTALTASRAMRRMMLIGLALTAIMSWMYWQVPTLLWNQEDGINLFLIHWFGGVGRALQEYLPNFFLPPIAAQVQALFYAAVLMVLSIAAYRELTRGDNKPNY